MVHEFSHVVQKVTYFELSTACGRVCLILVKQASNIGNLEMLDVIGKSEISNVLEILEIAMTTCQ